MINKKLPLLVLIATFMLLFGCVDYNYSQQVYENGDSTLTLEMDFTKQLEEVSLLTSEPIEIVIREFEDEKELECSKIVSEHPELRCEADGSVVTISKQLERDVDYIFKKSATIPNDIYEIEVLRIPNLDFVNSNIGVDNFVLGSLDEQQEIELKSLEQSKVRVDYSIEMPGEEIFEARAGDYKGEVDGLKASFNLFEVGESQSTLVVKSQSLNVVYLYLAILVAIVAVGFVVYTLLFKQPIKAKPRHRTRKKKKR